jgi:hypothetical protein
MADRPSNVCRSNPYDLEVSVGGIDPHDRLMYTSVGLIVAPDDLTRRRFQRMLAALSDSAFIAAMLSHNQAPKHLRLGGQSVKRCQYPWNQCRRTTAVAAAPARRQSGLHEHVRARPQLDRRS